ncbi:hypothetical protein COV82_01910 [Candidatus Peregrinibacteria bacterium CG11_big_fil_rev_8_21_14_0_20_46_8]|nr:MAG: hypothetical protein COV82_01910 [Candidatus Peregrinibacteria bacterium CG11_big_fil_rev_8_21_14_0_20_46_8]
MEAQREGRSESELSPILQTMLSDMKISRIGVGYNWVEVSMPVNQVLMNIMFRAFEQMGFVLNGIRLVDHSAGQTDAHREIAEYLAGYLRPYLGDDALDHRIEGASTISVNGIIKNFSKNPKVRYTTQRPAEFTLRAEFVPEPIRMAVCEATEQLLAA